MISLRLADIFTNMAEAKKAASAGRQDIMSLMAAARTVRDDPAIIEKVLRKGDTGDIPGIDHYCHDLIAEYLDKGSIEEYEKLSSRYHEDLIRFVRVTGLGRKRLLPIYDACGIEDIEDLKDLFSGRKAREVLKHMPAGRDVPNLLFVERVQRSLDYLDSIAGKSPRWPAEYYGNRIIDALKGMGEIEKVEYTGSIRRKKPVIGDIDLLVLPAFNSIRYDHTRSPALLESLSGLPFVEKLVSINKAGEDISGKYRTVYEIDLEVIIASGPSMAWQLLKTTGSRDHLRELEDYIRNNRGTSLEELSIGESGSEEEIYSCLGLDYIPPELREGKGEVMLSAQGRLPRLVRPEDIKGDLHIHSTWSDGLIDYEDIIKTARDMDYEYIGISDHSLSNYYGNGLDTARLLEKMDFMDGLRKKYPDIRILMGGEVDVKKPGVFDYEPGVIKRLDIAIASLHSSFTNSCEENTSRAVSALSQDYFDLVAHPTGVVFGNRCPIFIDMERVIEAAASHGRALEVNSYFMRLDLDEDNARRAAGAGALLAVNTDSHRQGNMEMIGLGIDVARRAGLEPEDIVNTRTAAELRDWRRERGR